MIMEERIEKIKVILKKLTLVVKIHANEIKELREDITNLAMCCKALNKRN